MRLSIEVGETKGPAITGWGKHLPASFTNEELLKLHPKLNSTPEKVAELTGILSRGIETNPRIATSHMAALAGERALVKAGLSASRLDEVIVATITPDFITPATAALVLGELHARKAVAYDINAACCGFLLALRSAFSLVKSGQADHILVAGAEKLSTITNREDRDTCFLFADGAGALVIENTARPASVAEFYVHSDPDHFERLYVPAGGSREPLTRKNLMNRQNTIHMEGKEVFKGAINAMSESVILVLGKAGVSISDIDLVIPHQANLRIIDAMTKKLKISDNKVFENISRCGNTSSATIPIAITEAVEQGRLKPGMLIALPAYGAGFSWGCAVLEWTGEIPQKKYLSDRVNRLVEKIRNRIFQIPFAPIGLTSLPLEIPITEELHKLPPD